MTTKQTLLRIAKVLRAMNQNDYANMLGDELIKELELDLEGEIEVKPAYYVAEQHPLKLQLPDCVPVMPVYCGPESPGKPT